MASKNIKVTVDGRDNTGKAFNSVNKRMAKMNRGFGAIKGKLLAIGAIVSGVVGKNVGDAADNFQKTALRLGTTTEELTRLSHAAELSGVEFETLSKGLANMQKMTSEAAQGTGMMKLIFEDLGMSAKDLAKLKIEDQFMVMAEMMNSLEDQADKTRIAMTMFGARGLSLVQMMGEGAGGIEKMKDEADKLGLTLSGENADAIAAMNDGMTNLKNAMTGVVQTILGDMAPALALLFNWLANVIPEAVNRASKFFGKISKGLGEIKEEIVTHHNEQMEVWEGNKKALIEFGQRFGWFTEKTKESTDATGELGVVTGETVEVFEELKSGIDESATALQKQMDLAVLAGKNQLTANEGLANMVELQKEAARVSASLRTPLEIMKDTIADLTELVEAGVLSWDDYARGIVKARETFDKSGEDIDTTAQSVFEGIQQYAQDSAQKLEDGLVDALMNVGEGFESLKNLAKSVLNEIAAEIMRVAIARPIAGAISTAIGNAFGGGKQHGGPVHAGRSYLVGEAGPELFTPGQSGGITPNAAMGSTPVHVTYNINSWDSRDTAVAIQQSAPQIVGIIQNAFNQRGSRGPLG